MIAEKSSASTILIRAARSGCLNAFKEAMSMLKTKPINELVSCKEDAVHNCERGKNWSSIRFSLPLLYRARAEPGSASRVNVCKNGYVQFLPPPIDVFCLPISSLTGSTQVELSTRK